MELFFRLFDREHLQLIPALDFSCPLPDLEKILRAGGPKSEGIRWVGEDGRVWQEHYAPLRGMAAYYNILDSRVQDAMLAVIHELVTNYGGHPSLTGPGGTTVGQRLCPVAGAALGIG